MTQPTTEDLPETMSANQDDGSVRISPQKVYEEVLGMKDSLNEFKSLLERHVALQEQANNTVREDLDDLDKRVDSHDTELISVKTRLTGIDLDILVLKEAATKREARRIPWTGIVGAVASIITVAFLVLNQIQTTALVDKLVP